MSSLWPILDRFPRLADLPRVALRTRPTPIERVRERLWIKRDDLSAETIGGNKVRALEFLLGPYQAGDRIVTAGSRGSTHVLSTAMHARRLGIEVDAASWPQEMNDVARRVDARLERELRRRHFRSPITAALWLTWRGWRGDNVVPLGGTSALGVLGHINAALELAAQVRAGVMPVPDRIVVPFGTGGTAAGLSLGVALAELPTKVVAARVVPWIIGRVPRIAGLALDASELIQRHTGEKIVSTGWDVVLDDTVYGGAYGRPLAGAPDRAGEVPLDPSYSSKAFAAALRSAQSGSTLFWHTFDSRWMNA